MINWEDRGPDQMDRLTDLIEMREWYMSLDFGGVELSSFVGVCFGDYLEVLERCDV